MRVRPGEQVTADKLVALVASHEAGDVRQVAVHELEAAIARGYEGLRVASDAAWAAGDFVAWSRERRGDYVLWLRMAERRLPTR